MAPPQTTLSAYYTFDNGSRTKPSNNRAAQALRMAAVALHWSKTAVGAFFRKMRSRLGAPKAITATAHKLARILYRMLVTGTNYWEVGENYYEQQYQERVMACLKNAQKNLIISSFHNNKLERNQRFEKFGWFVSKADLTLVQQSLSISLVYKSPAISLVSLVARL